MLDLIRRSRGLAIALVVLALSAGAVFAGSGGGRPENLPATPSADEHQGAQGDEDQGDEQDGQETEAPETETPDTETPDAQDAGDTADNHGALVSVAAGMDTPEGFDNHGDFVSCVAHMKDVSAVGFDWTTVTKEFCDPTTTTTDGTASPTDGKQKPNDGKLHGNDGKQKHPNHGRHR